MLRPILLAMAFVAIAASAAEAQDKASIDKLNEAWTAALNKGDAAAVAAMYAEDATLLPEGSEMVKGRAGIQKFWQEAAQQVGDFTLKAIDVKALGDGVGREIGTFTARTKGAQPQDLTGKYVVIWQRVGSDWKLATDIWNTDN